MSEPIENFRHKKEKRYSAATYDQVFTILSRDKSEILWEIFFHNALEKWKRRDIYNDYRQELLLHLHSRYHEKQEELLDLFNGGTFNFWLVTYTRNHLRTRKGVFTRLYGERFEAQEDILAEPIAPEQEEESLDLFDANTIRWLLRTADFDRFDAQQKEIYLSYFELVRNAGKKVKMQDVADHVGQNYKKTRSTIVAINQALRKSIARIQSQ